MFQVLSVSGLATYLRAALESDPILQDCWIAGEASNLSRPSSGHVYFSLKDGSAQLRCVLFRTYVGRNPRFENGDAIVLHGRVSFYDVSGQLQVYADVVQPEGVGKLHLAFLALQSRLADEGLFDPLRKRPVPRFPERIVVITSPSGAVLHDICTVIERRYRLVEIVVAPAQVQGSEAASTICRAFAEAASIRPLPDTVILARGGGSIEDLWAFNEESVARAIFACPIPVISAVGHETDVTIADLVADLRAPTPSVAAELAVPDATELRGQLDGLRSQLRSGVEQRFNQCHDDVEIAVERLRLLPDGVGEAEDRLRVAVDRAIVAIDGQRRGAGERHRAACLTLQALSPLLTLARGFATIAREADGRAVTSIQQVAPADLVNVRLRDGAFTSEVRSLCRKTPSADPRTS